MEKVQQDINKKITISKPKETDIMYLILVNGKYLSYVKGIGIILLDHPKNSIGTPDIKSAIEAATSFGYTSGLTFIKSTPLKGCGKFTENTTMKN